MNVYSLSPDLLCDIYEALPSVPVVIEVVLADIYFEFVRERLFEETCCHMAIAVYPSQFVNIPCKFYAEIVILKVCSESEPQVSVVLCPNFNQIFSLVFLVRAKVVLLSDMLRVNFCHETKRHTEEVLNEAILFDEYRFFEALI